MALTEHARTVEAVVGPGGIFAGIVDDTMARLFLHLTSRNARLQYSLKAME
jgi:hypothetical protein